MIKFSAHARAVQRFSLSALLCGISLFIPAAQSASAAIAQPVPTQKPQSVNSGNRIKPKASPEEEQNLLRKQRLGTIDEQSPLLAPRQSELFSPSAEKTSPEPQAAMPNHTPDAADFPLNEAVLTRLEKIHREILALPDSDESDTDDDISGSVDVLAKALERRPDIMGILGRNLISTRDYIIAMQAAANALAAAANVSVGKVSADNLAFGKKYADRIRALLEE